MFGFEHKHFTMQEAFFVLHSISYRLLFDDFELRNLSYNRANCTMRTHDNTNEEHADRMISANTAEGVKEPLLFNH